MPNRKLVFMHNAGFSLRSMFRQEQDFENFCNYTGVRNAVEQYNRKVASGRSLISFGKRAGTGPRNAYGFVEFQYAMLLGAAER